MITITHLQGEEWQVTVQAGSTTQHRVRVSPSDLERLGQGVSAERLLQESFRFLLERESNTSILRAFDLPVIGSYFPEYESDLRERLGGG